MSLTTGFPLACPIPLTDYPTVLLGHGGGGKLTQQLIERLMLPAFNNPWLGMRHDGAVMDLQGVRLAFTTDSYVVQPLIFPGGDIGRLAVNGTVNDLAMCGACPLWLSLGFILEEGLPMETLWRVIQSIQHAAKSANVSVVTGDTKVVEKGKGDGLFINTSGVGVVPAGVVIAPSQVRAGDAVLLSGDLGRHGIAIMAVREGLNFETTIESDTAPLADLVARLLAAKMQVHCLRDLTRGGLASGLIEIAHAAKVSIDIDETVLPIQEEVRGACELLGLDPLYVANEGRCVAFVAADDASRALELMRSHPLGRDATLIGYVADAAPSQVTVHNAIGSQRMLDLFSGEQLPRIC
ncbi:MAG: hydrogenase expression/formation protein HypE [Candidatus Omnitrophica bacterium]|nr:hydrogenase expression/formation protein HypE [Candidatus Omnitrophota bacterium]